MAIIKRTRTQLLLAGVGLTLAALSGCQAWVPVPGMTLPSPRYLEHPPQYIPESPPFPLPRELASITAPEAVPPPAPPLPVPVPPGGAIP